MYILIPQKVKCSKCLTVNFDPKTYWEGSNQYMECSICNHRSIVSTLTTAGTDTVYIKPDDNIKTF